MGNEINVRVVLSRETWAMARAKATRESKTTSQVVEEILKDHFGLEEG